MLRLPGGFVACLLALVASILAAMAVRAVSETSLETDNHGGNSNNNDNGHGNDDHGNDHGNNNGNNHNPPPPKAPKGLAFDRIIVTWMENTDFTECNSDDVWIELSAQSITLGNYFGVTHPSEPNYNAACGGDMWGMDNDNLNDVAENVTTIIHLLEDENVTYKEYLEDLPFSGFMGATSEHYARKHSPCRDYTSITNDPALAAKYFVNFSIFDEDIARNNLPNVFHIVPNQLNDAHDTTLGFGTAWLQNNIVPLLNNPKVNTDRTLFVIVFDESGSSPLGSSPQNRVNTLLLGNAVPKSLHGTLDYTFYTHYSLIKSIEVNWGTTNLGRYDVGANPFKLVADKAGIKLRIPTNPHINETLLATSYPGVFNTINGTAPYPIPNTSLKVQGKGVHPRVKQFFGSAALQKCTAYRDVVEVPDGMRRPVLPAGC